MPNHGDTASRRDIEVAYVQLPDFEPYFQAHFDKAKYDKERGQAAALLAAMIELDKTDAVITVEEWLDYKLPQTSPSRVSKSKIIYKPEVIADYQTQRRSAEDTMRDRLPAAFNFIMFMFDAGLSDNGTPLCLQMVPHGVGTQDSCTGFKIVFYERPAALKKSRRHRDARKRPPGTPTQSVSADPAEFAQAKKEIDAAVELRLKHNRLDRVRITDDAARCGVSEYLSMTVASVEESYGSEHAAIGLICFIDGATSVARFGPGHGLECGHRNKDSIPLPGEFEAAVRKLRDEKVGFRFVAARSKSGAHVAKPPEPVGYVSLYRVDRASEPQLLSVVRNGTLPYELPKPSPGSNPQLGWISGFKILPEHRAGVPGERRSPARILLMASCELMLCEYAAAGVRFSDIFVCTSHQHERAYFRLLCRCADPHPVVSASVEVSGGPTVFRLQLDPWRLPDGEFATLKRMYAQSPNEVMGHGPTVVVRAAPVPAPR